MSIGETFTLIGDDFVDNNFNDICISVSAWYKNRLCCVICTSSKRKEEIGDLQHTPPKVVLNFRGFLSFLGKKSILLKNIPQLVMFCTYQICMQNFHSIVLKSHLNFILNDFRAHRITRR